MPVTAKLSSKFYERFGDEATNELVEWFNQVDAAYRSDLREFNEINFGRFDSRLTERLALSDARLGRRLAEFEKRIEARLETRLAEFEAKFESRLARFEGKFEARLAELEARFEARLEARLVPIEERLAAVEASLVELDRKIETRTLSLRTEIAQAKTEMVRWMFAFWVATVGMMFLVRLI